MKKLISAASALAMAASMVGAAVPFATGAADASKSFELRPYLGRDGKAVSTEISAEEIAAGDVTVPIGVYIVEDTADVLAISAQWTVTSKDGDASNENVSFSACAPNSVYFDEAQSFTANGNEYKSTRIMGWLGKIAGKADNAMYSAPHAATTVFSIDTKQDSINIPNAFGSIAFSRFGTNDYVWTTDKSDEFPMFVFEVTFAKGTPAGTYNVDFIDVVPDSKYPDIYTSMVESEGSLKYAPVNNNLNLKGVEIKIGGETQPPATTTAPVTTASPVQTTTTAGNPDQENPNIVVRDDFVISGKEYTVEAGETIPTAEFVLEKSSGHKVSTIQVEFLPEMLPDGFTISMDDTFCYAFDHVPEYSKLPGLVWNANTTLSDGSADPADANDGDVCAQFVIEVADTVAPGKYEINPKRFQIVEKAKDPGKSEFLATVNPIIVNVEGEPQGTTTAPVTTAANPGTTTKAATTATKPATTAPTTTTPPVGNVLYGDANDNGVVDICDVVVLNKWLNDASSYDMTPQGKINADCCDEKGGEDINANDSDAIIKSIVHLVKALPCTSADLD